jgi:Carboxypeptidase regulatory-like domain
MTTLERLTSRSLPKMKGKKLLFNLTLFVSTVIPALSQQFVSTNPSSVSAPEPQPGDISGTVVDVNGGIVPGATVVLEDPVHREHRTVVANNDGAFDFDNLNPGSNYHVTISADGFVSWSSPAVVVNPGQFVILSDAKLGVAAAVSSVIVYASSEEIAAQQVTIEEHQRVFGFIPNFYVVYDHNPAPLTTKLKFKLALRASTDPIVFLGAAALAGMNQAGNRPDYVQGAKGYGQRLGVAYTDSFVDIVIGGAVLPSLLHQDPRYYYQGTGTTKSRALHALASPFICKGDNGRWQPNYSSIGGDLATGAIANAYYPSSNRGPGLVFQGALISSGGRMINDLLQEFILRRLTPGARNRIQ